MLYKNEEQYKISEPEIKALVKHFHNKFPVKVAYPPERVMKSKLPHNRLPDMPNSISFDLRAIVKTDSGTQVWRYAENVIVDDKGKKRYMPKKFIFNGIKLLERNDIELIFFLLRKSPFCLGGDNYQGKKAKFMFEDLVSMAEKKAIKKEEESKITVLLYNKDLGLDEDKLRAVANAFFISDVEGKTLAQVKIALDDMIHTSNANKDKFFEMIDSEEQLKTRGEVQKLIRSNAIYFNDKKRSWLWKASGNMGETTICAVPPTKGVNEALLDFYLGNQSFKDDVQAFLISRKPKNAKKPEEVESEE